MRSKAHYTTADLLTAYQSLGLQSGDTVYFTGNAGNFGFHESFSKTDTLAAHLGALQETLGSQGTLAAPTHTFSYCNTERIFDPQAAASERGPLTEHLRRQPGSVRQFHPFASVTALGAAAAELCGTCTRHAYGPRTPFDRMIRRNAWFLSLGLLPQHTCSIVHHMEMLMGVPYRYTKEYLQPVARQGQEPGLKEAFYQFVTYLGADLERDRNEKIFQHPQLRDTVKKVRVGLTDVWAYRMQDFEAAATECLAQDIYAWLRRPPENRPYQR